MSTDVIFDPPHKLLLRRFTHRIVLNEDQDRQVPPTGFFVFLFGRRSARWCQPAVPCTEQHHERVRALNPIETGVARGNRLSRKVLGQNRIAADLLNPEPSGFTVLTVTPPSPNSRIPAGGCRSARCSEHPFAFRPVSSPAIGPRLGPDRLRSRAGSAFVEVEEQLLDAAEARTLPLVQFLHGLQGERVRHRGGRGAPPLVRY